MRLIVLPITIFGICAMLYGGISYSVGSGPLAGTVLDNTTGLRWTRCSMLAGNIIDSSEGCTQSPARYTWEDALDACENLEFAGINTWRLPNIRELQSIVTYYQLHYPMINSEFFPNTMASPYWASTTYNVNSENPDAVDYAWSIDFYYGNNSLRKKNHLQDVYHYYVRCVAGP